MRAMFDRIKKKLKEEAERRDANWVSYRWLGDKKEVIRILPKLKNQRDIYFQGGRHFGIGEKKQSRLCPKLIYANINEEQSCPVCDAAAELFNSKSEEDKTMAKKIRAAQRFFFNVIIRGEEDKGVQILEAPTQVWEQIVNCYFIAEDSDDVDFDAGPYIQLDDGTVIFDFTNLKQGRDFVISRKQQGQRITYDVQMKEVGRKLGTPDEMKGWMGARQNLDVVIPEDCPSYDELHALLWGEKDATEEPEDQDPEDVVDAEEDWDNDLDEKDDAPEEDTQEEEDFESDLDEDDLDFDEETGEIVKKSKKTTTAAKLSKKMDAKVNRGRKRQQ